MTLRAFLRDVAIAVGVYLGLLMATLPPQPLISDSLLKAAAVVVNSQPELTRSGEVEPRSTIVARGKLTSAEHEQIEGSYELVSYATNSNQPMPGLSLRFPAESIGPLLMRDFIGRRVVVRIEVEK